MLSCGACAVCAGRPRCGDRGVLYVSKPLSPRHRLPLTGRHFARRVAACREESEAADLLLGLYLSDDA